MMTISILECYNVNDDNFYSYRWYRDLQKNNTKKDPMEEATITELKSLLEKKEEVSLVLLLY